MNPPRRIDPPPRPPPYVVVGAPAAAAGGFRSTAGHGPVDWKYWTRTLERKRRAFARAMAAAGRRRMSRAYLARVTRASFDLDGMDVTDADAAACLARGGASARAFRSRQAQRLRNHVALLRRGEMLVRRGHPLTPLAALRWYTSVACGLPTAAVGGATLARLDRVARRVNSPQLHLRPAVEGIAALYHELLADPLVPGFNGIFARLLLAFHLGRCGLPPVLFQPDLDRRPPADAGAALRRLLDLIDGSYDTLLGELKGRG